MREISAAHGGGALGIGEAVQMVLRCCEWASNTVQATMGTVCAPPWECRARSSVCRPLHVWVLLRHGFVLDLENGQEERHPPPYPPPPFLNPPLRRSVRNFSGGRDKIFPFLDTNP